ncbi:MAG: hypothetical protein KF819_14295 [Labilithrix sp.]|nr:hypothetical protein [Labilithrix sp.]
MRGALALAGLLVAGCSSTTGETSSPDAAPSGEVSFKSDVVPILAARCATSACHGNKENNLGVHLITSDPAAVYTELQRESPTATGAKFIVAGDPAKSFFYAKIEGTQDDFSSNCLIPGCGETMPPGTKLPGESRETIRRWIAEGAKNN